MTVSKCENAWDGKLSRHPRKPLIRRAGSWLRFSEIPRTCDAASRSLGIIKITRTLACTHEGWKLHRANPRATALNARRSCCADGERKAPRPCRTIWLCVMGALSPLALSPDGQAFATPNSCPTVQRRSWRWPRSTDAASRTSMDAQTMARSSSVAFQAAYAGDCAALAPLADGLGGHAIAAGQNTRGLERTGDL